MNTQQYSVRSEPVSTILAWVESGESAVSEMQRPLAWDAANVIKFLDSPYNGYPVGYLSAWRNQDVKLNDSGTGNGKKILMHGQQWVTALMAASLGQDVLTKDDKKHQTVT